MVLICMYAYMYNINFKCKETHRAEAAERVAQVLQLLLQGAHGGCLNVVMCVGRLGVRETDWAGDGSPICHA